VPRVWQAVKAPVDRETRESTAVFKDVPELATEP
jgi:hypothetical protein